MTTQIAIGQITPLVQPLPIRVGQTLRVRYSFSYKVAETTSIELQASLFVRRAGVIDRVNYALAKQTITLDRSLEWKTYSGEIDIVIQSGIRAGVYGLIVDIPRYEVSAVLDNVVRVIGIDLEGLISLGLVLGLVGMMVPMVKEAYG